MCRFIKMKFIEVWLMVVFAGFVHVFCALLFVNAVRTDLYDGIFGYDGALLLTWVNFNPSMDK